MNSSPTPIIDREEVFRRKESRRAWLRSLSLTEKVKIVEDLRRRVEMLRKAGWGSKGAA